MTAAQTLSSIALVRWLLSEYKLPKTAIHGHKYTPENAGTTDCPNHLFGQTRKLPSISGCRPTSEIAVHSEDPRSRRIIVLQQTTPVLAAAGGTLMVLIFFEDPLRDHPLG